MKQNICFAVTVAILCLASCQPKQKQQTEQEKDIRLKTEAVTWEENPESVEGFKFVANYPSDNTDVLSQNIREWMNECMGGTYTGSLAHGKEVMKYYGEQYVKQREDELAEFGEDAKSTGGFAHYIQLKKVFETSKFVTYTSQVYSYSGGAHGMESLNGKVFRKPDGQRIGWDMFSPSGKEKLRELIKERLMKNYFKAANEEEFYNMLLADNARYTFPLPESDPFFLFNGVQFVYQQYEIAPYAAGMPTCTLPYESLKDLFTSTMQPLVESTTDSIARSCLTFQR